MGVGYRPGLTTRFATLLFLWSAFPWSVDLANSFASRLISACRAPPFWRAVWRHAAFLGVGCRPGLTTRFTPLLFLWLSFPWSSERHTPTSATATVQVGHILCSSRSSDDLLLRLFYVDLVLRLGLNSVHFTSLMTHLGAVRFPPIRRSGARDGSLVSSALLSLHAF